MNKQSIASSLTLLKDALDALAAQSQALPALKSELSSLNEGCNLVAVSWSGSSFGRHANLYFGQFEHPSAGDMFDIEWGLIHGMPPGWGERTPEEVLDEILGLSKSDADIPAIERQVAVTVQAADGFREALLADLSWISADQSLAAEKELLDQIEAVNLNVSAASLVRSFSVVPRMTRDSVALSQGVRIAPHAYHQANVVANLTLIEEVEGLVKRSRRLIRQVEVRLNVQATAGGAEALFRVEQICRNFHAVARQLRSRHGSRPTLDINDEYDVQDLLHALLKVDFGDVRAEDWIPSYAGGASRLDFLLKNERIVIEAKKTRDHLADKEVGEQLIIDIAKYQQSPDCETLVCFVYDPEGRIGNPDGLASDLAALSNDRINVIVLIKPGNN